jgi:cytochrome P450
MSCCHCSDHPSELSLTASLRRLVDPRTGTAPSRERLLAEIGNQIMAPETAAHTISWVLYCVATNPGAEARLLAELRGAGLPCNGDMDAALAVLSSSFDPLKGLPFLQCVVNEAQRLYPAGASASPRCVC